MSQKQNRLSSLMATLLIFSLTSSSPVIAQSGRGRRNTPPPRPKAENQPPNPYKPTVLNIPDGGQVIRHEGNNITQRFVLKNGLTVVIRERLGTGLSAMVTYLKLNEEKATDSPGLASLTSQMLFRGTATRTANNLAAEIRRLGGEFGNEVSDKQTSFYTIAPAESLVKLVEIQADLLLNPAFAPEEISRATQSLTEERLARQDDVISFAQKQMSDMAFAVNSSGTSVTDSFTSVTREQIQTCYQQHFTPKNTVLVIVGDLITAQVIGRIQQLYGNFGALEKKAVEPSASSATPAGVAPQTSLSAKAQPQSAQPQTASTPPAPTDNVQNQTQSNQAEATSSVGLRYQNERGDISHAIITIGHHAPALTKTPEGLKEQAAMELLSAVLGLGRGSRLMQGLRERKGAEKEAILATDISVSYIPLPETGLLTAQLRIDPDRIDRAEAEYFRELERIRRELLSEGELQHARSLLEKQYSDLVTAASDEAALLAHYQAQYGDYRLLDSRVARLRAVTAKEVQEVAAKYLTLKNTTIHEYEPRNAQARTFTPEKFAELISVFAPSLNQPVRPEDIKPAVALRRIPQGAERGPEEDSVTVAEVPLPIKDFSVFRGPRAYVREDHTRRKLTVGIFFQGGRLVEDQTTSGSTELMLRCLLKSTTTRKADLIAHEMESYGGEIQIVNEPDFFGYRLDVLSRNAENAVRLLLDIIENPFFDKAEIAREQTGLLARQLQQHDDSEQRARELLYASLYPGHPYGLPRYGLADVVKGMSEEKLESWHNRTIRRQYPLVILVGDTDGSALVASIFTEGLKRNSSDLDQALKVNLPGVTEPQEMVEQRERRLTRQAIGFRSPEGKADDLYALNILEQFTSGPGGRFFTELHEKQGLARTVTLSNHPHIASGLLEAFAVSLPGNEQKVRDGLRAELEKLISNPPSDEEFERGRNAAIGSYAIALQSQPTRLLEYARAIIFGRKPADVENQPELIRAVKKEDIKRVAEKLIRLSLAGRGAVRGSN